jgi:exosortase family protein XrtM
MKKKLWAMKRFALANSRELRFIFLFVLIFVVAQSLYYFSNSVGFPDKLQHVNAVVSASLINTFSPGEKITVAGRNMKSGGFSVVIAWGCEGIEGIFIIIAALSAYSMGLRKKLLGIFIGTVIMYCLNIVRIIVIYCTIRHKPAMFDIMHIYIGQTFIIFFGVFFFVAWIYFFSLSQPLAVNKKLP